MAHPVENFMTLQDAIDIVLRLARETASTENESIACDVVEDFAVNQLGDD